MIVGLPELDTRELGSIVAVGAEDDGADELPVNIGVVVVVDGGAKGNIRSVEVRTI